jgi:hypothetical protein
MKFPAVIPSKLPLLILGGIAFNLSGHFANCPPAISLMFDTSGNGVKHVSILVYLQNKNNKNKSNSVKAIKHHRRFEG